MTSVTATTMRTTRATEGARRATGVALAHVLTRSRQRVVVLLNRPAVDLNLQFFQPHVNARHHVLVDGLRGQTVLLSKDVQPPITPDEAHQMIATLLGLGQRILRCFERHGETNSYVALLQGHLRRLPLQFAIAIPRVVLMLEGPRLVMQIFFASYHLASKKTVLIMVVEFFHHTIPPGLCDGNEPRLNSIQKTKANQDPHTSWMSSAAVKHQFIVHLNILRNPQTAPTRPDRIQRVLPCLAQYGTQRAASGRQIHTVQTVKANRPLQVARTHIIHFMDVIRALRGKFRIFSPFRLVTPGAAMGQFLPVQNAIDRTHRRVVFQAHLFQFPDNRLSTAEQAPVVQVQSCQLHGFNHLGRTAPGVSMRTPGSILGAGDLRVCHSRALDPFVDPPSAIAQRIGDGRYRFSLPKTFQGPNPILLLRLFHRWLLSGSAIDAAPKLGLSKMLCQKTVHDVAAHLPVHDVAALVSYYLVRVFHKHVGIPPHKYQTIVRIHQARKLLNANNSPRIDAWFPPELIYPKKRGLRYNVEFAKILFSTSRKMAPIG